MDNTKILETDRLILRKFKIEDAEGVFNNWATDPNTNKFLSWDLHKDINETKDIITKWIEEYEKGSYNWIVELKETHEVIGSIGEQGKSLKHKTISLGYCYGSKYWNKGYASEALKRVIEYLLVNQDFYLVEANHRSSNPASGRVMQKAGMIYDGTLRKRRIDPDGTRSDMSYYSITQDELNLNKE